ncbi:MAG TPA: hypothetical protein VIO64_11840 [Pseudobacteroides sp.]|uniref:hypothetical protein n=1 Tax=Pseudobacteroides sp. TaxID=1968840 RepID=UPI002F928D6F
MEKRRLSCSKDWTTLSIANFDEKKTLYLNYNDINRIEFDEILINKLFRKIRTEKIQIFTNTSSTPIEFIKHNHEKYFEEYKQELSKFARDNKISLIDRIVL